MIDLQKLEGAIAEYRAAVEQLEISTVHHLAAPVKAALRPELAVQVKRAEARLRAEAQAVADAEEAQ